MDLIGKKFGRLLVLEKIGEKKYGKQKRIVYKCHCDCGNICAVEDSNLGTSTLSCGCIKAELLLKDCVEKTRLRNLTNTRPNIKRIKDSGVKGVSWDTAKNKWKAQIGFQGKIIYLGRYKNLEDAMQARKDAEELYYKPILDKYKNL